jgi:hypothetical protein
LTAALLLIPITITTQFYLDKVVVLMVQIMVQMKTTGMQLVKETKPFNKSKEELENVDVYEISEKVTFGRDLKDWVPPDFVRTTASSDNRHHKVSD